MTKGYEFYFKIGSDVLTFPITPGELTIKIGSNNKVVTLINEGDINILKSPSLVEVKFDARFPMRDYPYSRKVFNFQYYFNKFKDLKENKKSFRFIVARSTPDGVRTWDTNLLVSLESFELSEDADEGDDVIISFELKQFKEYGSKKIPNSYLKTLNRTNNTPQSTPTVTTTSTSEETRPTEGKDKDASQTYTVKSGDCLWNIAKKFYGDGSKWTVIYNANKTVIEETAKRHGKQSSSNGHWIYPGTKLIIPSINTANNTVTKKTNSTTATVGSNKGLVVQKR